MSLDPVGWFIASAHELLGHAKTAALIGAPAGDPAACIICRYERERTPEARLAVYAALAPDNRGGDDA